MPNVEPQHWRRKKVPVKVRAAVLESLRGDCSMTPRELAQETGMPWRRVCVALDALMIGGQVDLTDGRFRRSLS